MDYKTELKLLVGAIIQAEEEGELAPSSLCERAVKLQRLMDAEILKKCKDKR